MADPTPDQKPGDTKPVDTTITGDQTKPADKKADDKKPAGEAPAKTADELAAQKLIDDKAAADQKVLDDAAAADAQRKADEGKPPSKAPEKYTLTLPDDAGGYLDESDLTSIAQVAKAQGWTNEQAQKALEDHARTLAANSATFRAETEADPVLGGEHLAETTKLARMGLEALHPADTDDGKQLRRLLAKTGFGNNRLIVSGLRNLGKRLAEDAPPAGGSSKGGTKDAATVLYGQTAEK